MVNPVSYSPPYPYTTGTGQNNPQTTTPSSSNNPLTNSSVAKSLLSGTAGAYTPEVLSLLQGPDSAGNFEPISSLLGGSSTNNALTDLLNNLYTTSTSAAITQAEDNAATGNGSLTGQSGSSSQATAQPAGAALINNLINSFTQASVAYDNTLLNNAQSVQNNISQTA